MADPATLTQKGCPRPMREFSRETFPETSPDLFPARFLETVVSCAGSPRTDDKSPFCRFFRSVHCSRRKDALPAVMPNRLHTSIHRGVFVAAKQNAGNGKSDRGKRHPKKVAVTGSFAQFFPNDAFLRYGRCPAFDVASIKRCPCAIHALSHSSAFF